MTAVGPLDHIARLIVPWRDDVELTECGKQVTELPAERVVTVEQVQRRIRDVGVQRAAFTTCMTCWNTAERWHDSGQANRLGAIRRELEALLWMDGPPRRSFPAGQSARADTAFARASAAWERRQRFERELDAILALIAAHRDEFHGFLTDAAATTSLADARARRTRRGGRRG